MIKEGRKVKAGEMLGHVGSSGNSTGPHVQGEARRLGAMTPEEHIHEAERLLELAARDGYFDGDRQMGVNKLSAVADTEQAAIAAWLAAQTDLAHPCLVGAQVHAQIAQAQLELRAQQPIISTLRR